MPVHPLLLVGRDGPPIPSALPCCRCAPVNGCRTMVQGSRSSVGAQEPPVEGRPFRERIEGAVHRPAGTASLPVLQERHALVAGPDLEARPGGSKLRRPDVGKWFPFEPEREAALGRCHVNHSGQFAG